MKLRSNGWSAWETWAGTTAYNHARASGWEEYLCQQAKVENAALIREFSCDPDLRGDIRFGKLLGDWRNQLPKTELIHYFEIEEGE